MNSPGRDGSRKGASRIFSESQSAQPATAPSGLRRELAVSFAVQGAGAAAVLLATLWLGARAGPEVQGNFSRLKAEVEFVAALAMFGLPQALFYFVKSGRLTQHDAWRWVSAAVALALPIGAIYALVQHRDGGVSWWTLMALAVAACVGHNQLRSLLLVHDRTIWFNVVTAAPQVLVLAGIGLASAMTRVPGSTTWLLVFATAFAMTAGFEGWRLQRAGRRVAVPTSMSAPTFATSTGDRTASTSVSAPARIPASAFPPVTAGTSTVGWRALGHYGLAAWLTAALATAAVVAAQGRVEAAAGRAALGQFTMAMTLVQVPLTPIAYAAPLLLRRWMERPGAQASQRWSGIVFGLLLGVAALVAALSTVWPDLGLGAAYGDVALALALLLVGGAAEAASRLLAVQASATGLPWLAVRAEVARWTVLGAGWWAPGSHGLAAMCVIWSAAACAAAAVFAVNGWQGRHGRHTPAGAAGRP